VLLIGDLDRLLDSPQPVGGDKQQAVVGAYVEATFGALQRYRLAVAPDAGVDNRDVDTRRHVRECLGQNERSLKDVLGRDPMSDVDHLSLGRNALDDAAADAREVVLEPKVGQEGDEPA
jgi:hypothetical protein